MTLLCFLLKRAEKHFLVDFFSQPWKWVPFDSRDSWILQFILFCLNFLRGIKQSPPVGKSWDLNVDFLPFNLVLTLMSWTTLRFIVCIQLINRCEHEFCRLLEHLRTSRRGRSSQWQCHQILRTRTAATASMVLRKTAKSRASHHPHHPQLRLITERPREEREYHTVPQWWD